MEPIAVALMVLAVLGLGMVIVLLARNRKGKSGKSEGVLSAFGLNATVRDESSRSIAQEQTHSEGIKQSVKGQVPLTVDVSQKAESSTTGEQTIELK